MRCRSRNIWHWPNFRKYDDDAGSTRIESPLLKLNEDMSIHREARYEAMSDQKSEIAAICAALAVVTGVLMAVW
jgi:hypothetical protein